MFHLIGPIGACSSWNYINGQVHCFQNPTQNLLKIQTNSDMDIGWLATVTEQAVILMYEVRSPKHNLSARNNSALEVAV